MRQQTDQSQTLLDRLGELSESIIARLTAESARLSRYLASEVGDILSEFAQRNGRIVSSVANIRQSQQVGKRLTELIRKSGYSNRVKSIVAEFNLLAGSINDYMSGFAGYESKELYKAVIKANIQTTVNILVDTGLNQALITPITITMQIGVR